MTRYKAQTAYGTLGSAVFTRNTVRLSDFPGIQRHHSLPDQQMPPHHVQVRQGQERGELRPVLGQSSIPGFAVLKRAF